MLVELSVVERRYQAVRRSCLPQRRCSLELDGLRLDVTLIEPPYRRFVDLPGWATATAEKKLRAALPRRWTHVQSVCAEARRIAPAFADGEVLVAAAVLHDVGYAPDLAATRFHPLDGARFLQTQDAPARLCALIARHSCALKEAELRGCADDLAEFPDEETPLRDALWYCDMVTGPDGQRLTVDDRLAEIQSRYGPESIVGQFIDVARPELLGAVERTIERYTAAGIPQPRYG